jgi:hypothetical protein
MPDYRAYLIGSDDLILERIDVAFPNDAVAVAVSGRPLTAMMLNCGKLPPVSRFLELRHF